MYEKKEKKTLRNCGKKKIKYIFDLNKCNELFMKILNI